MSERVVRQWGNTIAGWALGFGLLAVALIVDPLGVWVRWSGAGQGFTPTNMVFLLWFAVLGVGGFAVFARPEVWVFHDKIVLRNILTDVSIPISKLEALDTGRSKHLRVKCDGVWHRAWGAEKSGLAMLLDKDGVAGRVESMVEARSKESTINDGSASVVRRRPHPAEVLLLSGWLVYLILGAFHARW